jgi:predicted transcriptional regulator
MAKKKIDQIKTEQLQNLVKDCRSIINAYIKENDMSVHGFSKMTGVHPNQMYLFLKADRGLNLTTMQKIGEILSK